MFINCPSCHGLVATDPATDLPPERCPRCAASLRELASTAAATAPVSDARSAVAAAVAEAVGDVDAGGAANPAEDRAAQPAISIANLLQAETDAKAEPAPLAPPPESGASVDVAPGKGQAGAKRPVEADAEAEPPPAAVPVPAPAPTPATATPATTPASTPAPAPAPTPTPAPVTGPAARPRTRRTAPSFARTRRDDANPAAGGRRWPLPVAIAGLTLLLGLQWLLADRERLAADPAWRPLVAGACTVLRCSLPPWREPAAFTLLERDVRPHPQAGDTLRITASFRNDAGWAQAWPELVLTLSDLDGRPLGARAFTPAEYLGGEPDSALVAPGEGAIIRMDVLEPGPGAVGFSFDFI